ncbi:TonB-dependent receptor [Sphingomonas prati]|uniref:TonB-dependent receptor n=1 Tax=Sphingomonas prati TaxID=1843237 RepID=A0A7W9F442_9SPHN|nr:TonB-dependent receptor [Sphingomonas prati]MBB5730504.1 TonB-dependent receptor [Sphingomonas prati]GGE94565.1 TonB-dependent receptor [Sphingomonas prati]
MKTILIATSALGVLAFSDAAAAQTVATGAADDTIVVTGQRAQQERSIQVKRDAIGVVDVAAADEIGRLPDRNVAEVIEHLPGVGVSYDQGEGRYVAIRGVPSNLNNYTLNGLEIGNPDGTTRALPLDIISGQLLNRVEVVKVKTADMDGQGIGGTINLVTQTAFDFKARSNLAISAKAGYQTLNEKVPYQADASVGTRFGSDEQFGIVLGGSYSFRDFDSEGFYPDNWKPLATAARGGVPDNIKYTQYSLKRERISGTGSFDWHPSDTQTFYVRGVYSKFTEDEVRPRYRLDFTTTPFTLNPDGLAGQTVGVPSSATGAAGSGPERREDLRLDYKSKYLATGSVGGSTELDRLTLNYDAAYSRNRTIDRYPLWQFRCNPGTVNFDFTEKVYEAAPVTECTGNQLQFRQYQEFDQVNVEKIWQGKIDATYTLDGIGDGGSFLKFGGKYRDTDRTFDQDNPTWVRASATGNRWTLGQYGLDAPGECVNPDSAHPKQCYFNAPVFDIAALQAFTEQNRGGALMPLDAATTLTNNTISDFALKEKVAAGYAMANLAFGAVTLTPGLRYEHTTLDINGFRLAAGAVSAVAVGNSYDDWLPSLIMRIKPSDDTVFRFAYSKSLGRPEYSTLSPGGSIDSANNAVSLGNAELKPYRADNLDATAEWYFARGGILSVGAFAKFIRNPIFSQVTVLRNTVFDGVTYPVLNVTQPLNADKGDIVGIEAQYQQQFSFLPGLLSGFGITLNGTLTDSSLRLPDGRLSSFPSQSKYLYGAELFYQKGRLEASVAYHNTGYSLLAIGSPAYNDQYNDDLRRLDAKASFALLENVRLFAEAQNLTDEPTRQYQAGNKNWLIQNERYGRTFYAGISAKF